MIPIDIICIIIMTHWIADFVMQSGHMATNKSTNIFILIQHGAVYSSIFFFPAIYIMGYNIWLACIFTFITFITHTVTDYFTSKSTKTKFDNKEYYTDIPNTGAFSLIGFDQTIHYLTLILTYWFII